MGCTDPAFALRAVCVRLLRRAKAVYILCVSAPYALCMLQSTASSVTLNLQSHLRAHDLWGVLRLTEFRRTCRSQSIRCRIQHAWKPAFSKKHFKHASFGRAEARDA